MSRIFDRKEFKIKPFKLNGITLKESFLKRQYDETRNLYVNIPNNDLLKGFRERVNKPAPGKDLGGWYSGTYGHVFGRILGSFARMYRAKGDMEVKQKVEYLLEEWAKCIEDNGYCFYRKPDDYPIPEVLGIQFQDEYHKLLFGLLDVYEYADLNNAAKYAEKITSWAINEMSRDLFQCEGYKLSEVLYRAYFFTDDVKYRDLARAYHYTQFWDNFLKGDMWDDLSRGKSALLGKHVFSHVDSLNGAVLASIETGDEKYLQMAINAANLIRNNHIYATGLFGPHEHFTTNMIKTIECDEWGNSEISCNTWAMNKLLKYLMCITKDSRYGDWIEKQIYNGVGAQPPVTSDGMVMYFGRYFLGGAEKNYNGSGPFPNGMIHAWTCCAGSFPLNITEYYDMIYFKDDDSLYVNLFVPSSIKWQKDGANIEIEQSTDYPSNGNIKLKVKVDKPVQFGIKIRIPEWVNGLVGFQLDGEERKVEANSGRWAEFKNRWDKESYLDISIPLNLCFMPIDLKNPNVCALNYGNITLASDISGPLQGSILHPSSWIIIEKEKPLTFRVEGQWFKRYFRPYYELKIGERYFMYNYIDEKL